MIAKPPLDHIWRSDALFSRVQFHSPTVFSDLLLESTVDRHSSRRSLVSREIERQQAPPMAPMIRTAIGECYILRPLILSRLGMIYQLSKYRYTEDRYTLAAG